MQLTFFRHGEVENPAGVIYGALPGFGLSAAGRAKVAATARNISKNSYRRLLVSPLQRAQETATIIQTVFPDLKIETDERLTEWVYVSEGLTREQWQQQFAALRDRYHDDPFSLPTTVNGRHFESFTDVEARMTAVVDELIKNGQSAIIVSHGDPIMLALAPLLNTDYRTLIEKDGYLKRGEQKTVIVGQE